MCNCDHKIRSQTMSGQVPLFKSLLSLGSLIFALCACKPIENKPRFTDKQELRTPEQEVVEDLLRDFCKIEDNRDPLLHTPLPPSVDALVEIGAPAIDRCLDVFAEDVYSGRRFEAARVIEKYTAARFGYSEIFGWNHSWDQHKWLDYMEKLGKLNFGDSVEIRRKIAAKWRDGWKFGLPN